MTLALFALAVLAIVIFAFVLEPIVRARGDRAILDSAALPEHDDAVGDDATFDMPDGEPAIDPANDSRVSNPRVSIDRPAGSDAS